MFSRPCIISHFQNYSRSFQYTRTLLQQNDVKFSTTIIVQQQREHDNKHPSLNVKKTSRFLDTSEVFKKLSQRLSRNKISTLGVTGLALSLDGDGPNNEKSDIISHADQTVTQLLGTKSDIPIETVVQPSSANLTVPDSSAAAAQTIPETSNIVSETVILGETIPDPPLIPDIPIDVFDQLNALGQPTFASLGLGGWTPVGLIQNCFEYFNVTLGVPWWETIILGTLIIRLCLFPLVIIAQRNAARMNNTMPQLQVIQLKLSEAKHTGNHLDAARYSQEMMLFMKEKGLNPFKNMVVPLAQMPVFVSFFISLRQMANVPVDSLKTGGLWWFTDLTLPDQFFIMPVVTSLTLWATIELGTDAAKLSSQNMQTMKYVLRALPLCILPFTINFPGAILVYWTASNFISLGQVGFLKIPAVRDYFKIEKQVYIDPTTLPVKPKGFTEGIKESWTNMKIVNQLEERRRLDDIQFRRAGRGPIVKTYKYDPTKQVSPSGGAPISAKER